MRDPLQALLEAGALETTAFGPSSRYHAIATATMRTEDGRTVAYLRRRFVPPPDRFPLQHEHTVVEGDRLDNLAAHHLGDPELFWRLCDANAAMRPEELTDTVGRRIRIALPEGFPGSDG